MQKPIILIVDDDSISQTTLHTYLSPIATVKSAYDGYSALDQMSRGAPDLVILDNVMPGLTGLDLSLIHI